MYVGTCRPLAIRVLVIVSRIFNDASENEMGFDGVLRGKVKVERRQYEIPQLNEVFFQSNTLYYINIREINNVFEAFISNERHC